VNRDATIRAGAVGDYAIALLAAVDARGLKPIGAAEMSAHALFDLNQRIRRGERPAIAGTAEPCTKVRSA
jgi:hypothetical protein